MDKRLEIYNALLKEMGLEMDDVPSVVSAWNELIRVIERTKKEANAYMFAEDIMIPTDTLTEMMESYQINSSDDPRIRTLSGYFAVEERVLKRKIERVLRSNKLKTKED